MRNYNNIMRFGLVAITLVITIYSVASVYEPFSPLSSVNYSAAGIYTTTSSINEQSIGGTSQVVTPTYSGGMFTSSTLSAVQINRQNYSEIYYNSGLVQTLAVSGPPAPGTPTGGGQTWLPIGDALLPLSMLIILFGFMRIMCKKRKTTI